MYSVLRILVYVVLVSTTLVSSNERKKRAEWIDLGSSIVLPWESTNTGVPQGRNIGRVQNSQSSRINNIDARYQNERDAQQLQGLRNSLQLSNGYNNKNAINSNLVEGLQRQISTLGRNRIQQNGYSGLSAYSVISPNINENEENQSLFGRTGARQTQYSPQLTNLPRLGLGGYIGAQRNIGYNKISTLGRQLNINNVNQGTRSSLGTLNVGPVNAGLNSQDAVLVDNGKLNQLSNVVGRFSIGNIQERIPLNSIPQLDRSNAQLNQENVRTVIPSYNLGQSNDNAYRTLNQQYPIGQEGIQQFNQYGLNQGVNDNRDDGGERQSLGGINDQQVYRVAQPSLVQLQGLENNNEQESVQQEQNRQKLSGQGGIFLGNIQGARQLEGQNQNLRNSIPNIIQNPVVLVGENQQRPNVYTYGELGARIWKVIRANPSMISNLENLRNEILNGNNSENPQVRELKGLLQQAQEYNRNNAAAGNVEQSPEEQQQNALVANLIGAMNKNVGIPNQLYVQGHIPYGV